MTIFSPSETTERFQAERSIGALVMSAATRSLSATVALANTAFCTDLRASEKPLCAVAPSLPGFQRCYAFMMPVRSFILLLPLAFGAVLPARGESPSAPVTAPKPQRPPSNMTLVDETGRVALVFDCDPAYTEDGNIARNAIDCTMYTVSVALETEPSAAEAELAKIRADFGKQSGDWVMQELQKMCAAVKANAPDPATPAELLAKLQDVCRAPQRKHMLEIAELMVRLSAETCVVRPMLPGVQRFTRSGTGRWLWNPGPTGLCSATTVGVLESGDGYRWTYTQTRLDADTSSELCRGLELNKAAVWKRKRTSTPLRCSRFSFE